MEGPGNVVVGWNSAGGPKQQVLVVWSGLGNFD